MLGKAILKATPQASKETEMAQCQEACASATDTKLSACQMKSACCLFLGVSDKHGL